MAWEPYGSSSSRVLTAQESLSPFRARCTRTPAAVWNRTDLLLPASSPRKSNGHFPREAHSDAGRAAAAETARRAREASGAREARARADALRKAQKVRYMTVI